MISVSSDFSTAASATIRKPKAKLDIVWTDPTIDSSIIVSATEDNRGSDKDQVCNGFIGMSKKWAHLDNQLKADGNFYPMPGDSDQVYNQVGWFGTTNCDSSAEWSTYPTLTVTFDSRAVIALFVCGDDKYNEYPVDFDIKLYDGVTLEHTENITGNTLLSWSKDISAESLSSITKMELIIKKWSLATRVVKISEFYTSFMETYVDDIVSINILEERIVSDSSLPVGNMSSNEVDLSIQNIKVNDIIDPFFPDNSNSLYKDMILKNRKLIPYIGFELSDGSIEYVKMGTYWSGDWRINEQSSIATVSGRDRFELLRKAEYAGSELYTSTNLYELAEVVLLDAKTNIPMDDLQYSIDIELQDYELDYGWLCKSSYFKAIETIVKACMGQAYMSKEDILIIEGPSSLT